MQQLEAILEDLLAFPTAKEILVVTIDRGEWPSGLYSLRQVTDVEPGRERSNFGWVTFEA